MTSIAPAPARMTRHATIRHFVMTRPDHFTVAYSINPWMDPAVPVSAGFALAQWRRLHDVYLDLGHTVDVVPSAPGLPDMVFAANGAFSVQGLTYGAKFAHAERAPEAALYADWLRQAGVGPVVPAQFVNEGEGDFLLVGDIVLAGTGFRTDPRAHHELAALTGLQVVSLRLVNPAFYHLDTALAVLSDDTIAYYPPAFDRRSRRKLAVMFPDAIQAPAADAHSFALNAVSDGLHVVLPAGAPAFRTQLAERGFDPIPIDVSELLKAGGGVKCCTLELRR